VMNLSDVSLLPIDNSVFNKAYMENLSKWRCIYWS
jgi:hypothetical protein